MPNSLFVKPDSVFLLNNQDYLRDKLGVKLLKDRITTLKEMERQVTKMDYYLLRYGLPMVFSQKKKL